MRATVSIIGYADSGKTTLLEKLIPELKRRGYRIAVIKHHHHDVDLDQPGKDTWRHAAAGADTVVLASPAKIAVIQKLEEEKTLSEIIAGLPDVDLVFTEGYKKEAYPKIEVYRHGISPGILGTPGELLAMVSDTVLPVPEVAWLSPGDISGIADIIEERVIKRQKE
jgi:molybdopterin-guanine dinucleotide biosynthesis protein B